MFMLAPQKLFKGSYIIKWEQEKGNVIGYNKEY